MTPAVGRLQRLGDLPGDRQGFVQWNRPLGNAVGERGTFDQLQDERLGTVSRIFFSAVDGGNPRVVQAGEDLRFSLEPGQAIRIGRESVGQDLQGNVACELCVGGAIDLTHPPLADEGGDVVVAKPVTDVEGHVERF